MGDLVKPVGPGHALFPAGGSDWDALFRASVGGNRDGRPLKRVVFVWGEPEGPERGRKAGSA